MKEVIRHEQYGEITYEENFWTGKKTLQIDGVLLNKVSKKEFQMADGTSVKIEGDFFRGASAVIGDETIRLTPKIKWYEIVLGVIPFVLILIWGNVVALCEIVPVVGGIIGGGISGALSCLSVFCIKRVKPIWLKILIAVAFVAVTFGICCGIGYAIVSIAS